MAETEIRLKIEIDSATGEVKIKNFGQTVGKVVEQSQTKLNSLKSSFTRIAEFGEKIFFLVNGFKALQAPLQELINYSNQQEEADRALASALQQVNQYTDENYKKLKDQASAIQSVTTVGDEQVQMLQTLGLNMGLSLDKLNEATKGAIGLSTAFKEAGLDQATAMKGLALAYQGDFTMLQRYIPALRTTKDVSEKMAIVQKIMTDGFQQAQDVTKTSAGRMKQFSNIVGDFKEKLGDLVKKALIPFLTIGEKVFTFLNKLQTSTLQFASVAIGLSVALFKVIPAIRGISDATKVLGISIKSALGWLGLIITAATLLYTAWATNLGGFQEKLKVAFEYLKWFVNYGKELIKGYIDFVKNYFGGIGKILSSAFKLDVEGIKQGLKQVADAALNSGQQTAERLKAITRERDRNITSIHAQYVQKQSEIDQKSIPAFKTTEQQKTKITEDEIKKRLQKEQELQDYKFQTGRLSLQEYQNILDQRIEAARQTYGEESIEYLKLIDQKKKLNEEAKQHALEQEKELQELRLATIQDAHQRELKELAIWYQEQLQKFAENEEAKALIEEQYRQQKREIEAAEEERRFEAEEARREWEWQAQEIDYQAYAAFLDRKVAYAKKKYGEQSLEYKKALLERANLDKQAALSATNIFSKLMDAFQGTNRTLFNIGKAAAIARAIINTYEAVTKAYTAYPYPWNLAAAAAQLALGYAQVRKITSVSFNESAGAKDQQFTAAQNKLKGIKPKIKGHAKGGKVEEPTLGLVGEAGPEIIAPEKDFIAVFKEMFAKGLFNIDFSAFFNRLLTQFENALNRMVEGFKIAFAPPAVEPMQFAGALAGGSVTNINQTTVQTDNSSIIELLNEIKELIENKELRAEIDAEELAIVVENGQEQLKRGEI
ncbi:hypothetical protein Calab_1538 [Caldithrix abyssi DSM 13497]|uniref:Phage tail length tape-measure protein n=1 Tax=Caldithrix abyssi DSM 13497 TaxID=880073 RepID=H1XQL2_CALAY|nr:hypothetical protein [Caldithrix abyssi]APF17002.1 Phage tail length tape-measure protein [Caldithrix abyssi DSM 13497]EHO41158.1 hypothetical protein Calab_1538 [Caldithrix abyssi DSM 13497]